MMKKLDPELRRQLQALQAETAALQPANAAPVRVIVEFTGDLADLTAVGFNATTVSKHPEEGYKIAPGTIPIGRLDDLASIDHVVLVSYPKQYRPLLDYSLPEIRATAVHNGTPRRKGSGVVIGIIDSGIDWRHRAFVDFDDRTSRILGIWDQLLTPKTGETTGPGGLGVVYKQSEINRGLQGTFTVRSLDTGIKKDKEDERSKGHGTHVAGIVAGDGSAATCCHGADTYVGVAPSANIIVVRSDFAEDNLISGIDFILNHPDAAGKPVVINMSLGGTVGPHDGTEPAERHIDSVVAARAGRAIVVAAGNSGDAKTIPSHVRATVTANSNADIEFTISDEISGSAWVDVWYDRAGQLNAQLTAPGGTVIGPANHGVDVGPLPANPTAAADRQSQVTLDSTINGTHGRDNNLQVFIRKPTKGTVPTGTWRLNLANPTGTRVAFHAWTAPFDVVNFLPPVNTPDGKIRASADSTVKMPGTSAGAITVANHASRTGCCDCWPSNDIVASSSRGPVARNAAANPKPTIAAPGLEITSAAADAANLAGNCCSCCPDACCVLYTDKTGTSMAAPHVAGAVALMFEENPNLTSADIVRHLRATARAAPGQPPDPNTWGAGKLDAQAAVAAVRTAAGGGGGGGGGGGPHRLAPGLAGASPGPTGRRSRLGFATNFGAAWLASDPVHHRHGPVPQGFVALRAALATLPDGERLAAAASRHFSEVRRLINTNRRVATMWHRANGPGLLRTLLDSTSGCSCGAFGERERRYLDRFVEQLELYGSPRLRAGLAQHRSAFITLLGVTAVAA
ncbi:S8 family serine peptidase [Micromonospora sp. LZ34]